MATDFAVLRHSISQRLDLINDPLIREEMERFFIGQVVMQRAEENDQTKLALLEKHFRPAASDLEQAWLDLVFSKYADNLAVGFLEIGGVKFGVVLWPEADDAKPESS